MTNEDTGVKERADMSTANLSGNGPADVPRTQVSARNKEKGARLQPRFVSRDPESARELSSTQSQTVPFHVISPCHYSTYSDYPGACDSQRRIKLHVDTDRSGPASEVMFEYLRKTETAVPYDWRVKDSADPGDSADVEQRVLFQSGKDNRYCMVVTMRGSQGEPGTGYEGGVPFRAASLAISLPVSQDPRAQTTSQSQKRKRRA